MICQFCQQEIKEIYYCISRCNDCSTEYHYPPVKKGKQNKQTFISLKLKDKTWVAGYYFSRRKKEEHFQLQRVTLGNAWAPVWKTFCKGADPHIMPQNFEKKLKLLLLFS